MEERGLKLLESLVFSRSSISSLSWRVYIGNSRWGWGWWWWWWRWVIVEERLTHLDLGSSPECSDNNHPLATIRYLDLRSYSSGRVLCSVVYLGYRNWGGGVWES